MNYAHLSCAVLCLIVCGAVTSSKPQFIYAVQEIDPQFCESDTDCMAVPGIQERYQELRSTLPDEATKIEPIVKMHKHENARCMCEVIVYYTVEPPLREL